MKKKDGTQSLGDAETHPLNQLTEAVIGRAIEVHRQLGPGLPESVYEEALCIEFHDAGIRYERQVPIPVFYKGRRIGEYRLDLLVENAVVVELKSVEGYDPVFGAQVLTYLRLTRKRLGLLVNFNSSRLVDGIRRFVLEPSPSL
jgi:GxxExxY protein